MRTSVLLVLTAWTGLAVAEPVTVPQSVPFAEDAEIAGKIRNECHINQQLGDFIGAHAREKGVATRAAPATDPSLPGRVLVVEIRDAVSEGNAFLGHHKSTSVRGALYQDGRAVAKFKGAAGFDGRLCRGLQGLVLGAGAHGPGTGPGYRRMAVRPDRRGAAGRSEVGT